MKFSAPPMIILLDVLFVILFLLALEQSPNIQIILPTNVWLKDTIVLSEDSNKKIQHWFNRQTGNWESFKNFSERKNRKFNFLIGRITCDDYQYCVDIPFRSGEIKKIYLKGDLYDQMAGLVSDSCLAFPKECVSVIYHVKKDGTIDVERLKNEYTVFKLILKDE